MSIKINGTDVVDNDRKGIFQSANVGTFANPDRPGSASTGDLIWSTTDNQLQVWNGSAWVAAVGSGSEISASGGSEFTPGNGYKIHVFTGSGSFTLSSPTARVEYAVIAGGGGGGAGYHSGGGGAGGMLVGSATWSAGTYSITVGPGGAGGEAAPGPVSNASNGSNSVISGPSGTYTAIGGGGGGSNGATPYPNGSPGGSGGGGYQTPQSTAGGNGTPGQGNGAGYSGNNGGGHGGGAGYRGDCGQYFVPPTFGSSEPLPLWSNMAPPFSTGPNSNGALGRALEWSLPSSYGVAEFNPGAPNPAVRWFGGGGACAHNTPTAPNPPFGGSLGGWGGGGQSSTPTIVFPGQANTGGGGGSANAGDKTGGAGGSGIVIIRYQTIQ